MRRACPSAFLSRLLPIVLLALATVSVPLRAAPAARATPASPANGADELETTVSRMARIGSCGSPSFSPDGRWTAFVSNLSRVPQVWKVPTDGGWPRLLTPFEDQVGGVVWSPDGTWLAVSVAPGGGLNQQIYLLHPDGSGLVRITEGGRDNNWLGGWSRDGRYLAFASSRLRPEALDSFLYDTRTGKVELVAKNPGIGFLTDLSPDDRRGMLWRMRSRGDSDLFLVDRETGAATPLTAHEGTATFSGGSFSPDGRTLYFSSNKDRDLTALARIRLDEAGEPGPLEIIASRDDAELESYTVTDDGKLAALSWNRAGRSELELLDLESGRPVPVPALPAEIAGGLTFSHDGRRLAAAVSGATRPQDVWILDRGAGPWREAAWRQLTVSPHAGVDLTSLVAPELVRYPAEDGLELSGWLYRPPGVAAPAPYVLSFHGGPEGQERPRFRSDYQALLALGIGVFAPNVRGSAGFGKRFVNLDNGALRVHGVEDIEASARYLTANGIAAPGHLGIMGGSYGGYMTMAGLTEYPHLFAAGADLFGVVNFETFFAHTEPWMAAISTVEYGDPVTQKDLLRKLSPIHKVDRVVAPTIVLHGANDTNVPVVEAEQVVDNLKARGVPVRYVLFPDEGHGFRKTNNRITATVAVARWFERYLVGAAAAGEEAAGSGGEE